MVAAAALVLGVSSARATALYTTNDIILTLSLTITTNSFTFVSNTNYTYKAVSAKLTNKNLLAMLGGRDFANETFSNVDQIAIAYDGSWNGDVVVVDKTGTNVLYDATDNGGNPNATFAINLIAIPGAKGRGTQSATFNNGSSGTIGYTMYVGGDFTLLDNPNDININGSGPSTVTFSQSNKGYNPTNGYVGPWTDSANFKFSGANNQWGLNVTNVTISGTVTAKGKGSNGNIYFLKFIIS